MSQFHKFIGNNRLKWKAHFIRVIKFLYSFSFTYFFSCIKTNSSRINYGFIWTASRHTHFAGRRWSFICNFLNMAEPFYFYIINKKRERSQFMLFAEFIIFHHFLFSFSLSFKTVTWWICIGVGVWRSLFVYIRNSFHLFGTFTGKQNHSSSVACISIYLYVFLGANSRSHKNIFMCFLHILHVYMYFEW